MQTYDKNKPLSSVLKNIFNHLKVTFLSRPRKHHFSEYPQLSPQPELEQNRTGVRMARMAIFAVKKDSRRR